MTFNAAAQKEIDKLYKGRHHVELSIGILQNGDSSCSYSGVTVLHDDIAADNPAIPLFLRHGFAEEYRTDEIVMLRKEL